MQFWRSRLFPFRASSTFDQSFFHYFSIYIIHLPRTVWLRFRFLDHCLLPFLPSPRIGQIRKTRIHTRARAHTHTRECIPQGVYTMLARVTGRMNLRGTGRKEISQRANRCLKRAVEDLPVSTELSLPSSFVRLYLFLFYSSLLSFLPFLSSLPTLFILFSFCANYYPRNNINRNNQVCEVIF